MLDAGICWPQSWSLQTKKTLEATGRWTWWRSFRGMPQDESWFVGSTFRFWSKLKLWRWYLMFASLFWILLVGGKCVIRSEDSCSNVAVQQIQVWQRRFCSLAGTWDRWKCLQEEFQRSPQKHFHNILPPMDLSIVGVSLHSVFRMEVFWYGFYACHDSSKIVHSTQTAII